MKALENAIQDPQLSNRNGQSVRLGVIHPTAILGQRSCSTIARNGEDEGEVAQSAVREHVIHWREPAD